MQNDPGFETSLGDLFDVSDQEGAEFRPFIPSSFEELLEQLAYAAQFTGGIQVIEGPRASGKTTLAAILGRDYLGQCPYVGALSASGAPGDVFLPGAAAALGLAVSEGASAGEAVAVLRSFAQSLHAQSQVAVLVIDDAHLLDQQTLAALASLLQTGGESVFGLHLVLWSEPGLVERLDELQLLEVPVHDFAVPPLAPDEMEAFANHFRQQNPASDVSHPQDLWEVTGGYIGLIKQRLESLPESVQMRTHMRKAIGGLPVVHVVALSLLVVVLLWALLAREPEREMATQTVELPVASRIGSAEVPQASVAGAKQVESVSTRRLEEVGGLEPVIDERELRNAIYGQSKPVPTVPAENAPQADARSEADTKPEVHESDPAVAQAGVTRSPAQPVEGRSDQESVSQPQPAAKAQPSAGPYDAGKLLAFDADSYSLQIMAAASPESLERFRAEQPNRAQLYLYRAQRQGRPWYLLLAGNYASKTAAADAIKALPQAQRSGGPWPRTLESIHQEIKEDRRS